MVDTFVIYDDVNFIKKGWINRNYILSPTGPILFSVPLKNASQNKLIKDTLIHENFDQWKDKFLDTLKHYYHNAINFNYGYNIISSVLHKTQPNQSISQLCFDSIKQILKYLDIKTKIIDTTNIYHNSHLKGQKRIIDICKQENATQYINLIGGQQLYNKELFEKENMELKFHKIKPCNYDQYDSKYFIRPFTPNLSIIDILMWCNLHQTQNLLHQYELI